MSDRLLNVVIVVVMVVWAANFVLSAIAWHGYQSNDFINGIFTSVVGTAVFAKSRTDKPGGDHRK